MYCQVHIQYEGRNHDCLQMNNELYFWIIAYLWTFFWTISFELFIYFDKTLLLETTWREWRKRLDRKTQRVVDMNTFDLRSYRRGNRFHYDIWTIEYSWKNRKISFGDCLNKRKGLFEITDFVQNCGDVMKLNTSLYHFMSFFPYCMSSSHLK